MFFSFKFFFFFSIVLFSLFSHTCGQDEEGFDNEQKAQPITLTRETLEQLMQMLSSACRGEMESALSNRGEFSDECKFEVQSALQSLSLTGDSPDSRRESSAGEQRQQPQKPQQQRQPQSSIISPTVGIIGFVAVLFSLAALYILYFNSVTSGLPSKKPKKLGKKKEQKLKAQQQQRA